MNLMHCAAVIAALAGGAVALAEPAVNIGDVVNGLSNTSAANTTRLIRGGVQQRLAGGMSGAWSGQPFIQAVEFDNANGFSHNARGNLLSLNFGTAGTGGTLFNHSTNGSNTTQGPLFTFSAVATVETAAQRAGGLSVSPDNTKIAGTFYDSGRVWTLDYTAGASIGTGTGANAANFKKSAVVNSGLVTFGTTWMDNDTIAFVAYNVNLPTLYTVDIDGTGNIGARVERTPLGIFAQTGSSRFADLEYQPDASPFVYCLYSQFAGVTENFLVVVDPASWTEVRTIRLDATVGTARELAMGPDGHLYITQFSNDPQNAVYVDVLRLDRDADGDIDLVDTLALGNNSSDNHARRIIGSFTDTGTTFAGIDVAYSGPVGTPGQPIVGSCCTSLGCVAQVTEAFCVAAVGANGLGGTYQGNGSNCDTCTVEVLGPCCGADGSCTLTTFVECNDADGLYYGDGNVCGPNACTGPGACCFTDGSCSLVTARDCYTQGGFYNGIGSTCAAADCAAITSPVATTFDFDGVNPLPDGRNLSFTVSPDNSASVIPGTFADRFDVFGVVDRAVNTDFADETNGALAQDTMGILPVSRTDKIFGVEDLVNPDNTGSGTATFTFDISGLSNVGVEIEMAAFGNFESANDNFSFTAAVDAGAPVTLFSSTVLEGQIVYAVMDRGTRAQFPFGEDLLDPVAINGVQIRNEFVRFFAPVTGTGSTLTLTFTASSDGSGEVFGFDNIRIRGDEGSTPTPCELADFNNSGGVTADDIFAFLDAWFAQNGTCTSNCSADINGQNNVTADDIFAYLDLWFTYNGQTCP